MRVAIARSPTKALTAVITAGTPRSRTLPRLPAIAVIHHAAKGFRTETDLLRPRKRSSFDANGAILKQGRKYYALDYYSNTSDTLGTWLWVLTGRGQPDPFITCDRSHCTSCTVDHRTQTGGLATLASQGVLGIGIDLHFYRPCVSYLYVLNRTY